MEYIDGQTVGEMLQDSLADKNGIYNQVAKAVSQLLSVPVPKGSSPGPVGGGHTQHSFFRDGYNDWLGSSFKKPWTKELFGFFKAIYKNPNTEPHVIF
jgi:hypothetical protein